MKLIQLTDYEDGDEVWVDPSAIRSMRRLKAEKFEPIGDEPSQEEGARTRIDTATDMFLVRETPAEIRKLAADLTP